MNTPLNPKEILGETFFSESPSDLRKVLDKFPHPWTMHDRGQGHLDIFDASGKYFAHIYLWDNNDAKELISILEQSKALEKS